MNGRETRARETATQPTGRSGYGRGSGVWRPAFLLALCVFICLMATAVAGAASASASAAETGRALRAPRVLAPEGVVTPLRPTLEWTKVKHARSYDLRIYEGSDLLRSFNGRRGTSRRVAEALPVGVTLTFKVRARNERDTGAWSKGARFVVSTPTPESPADTIASASPTFRWGALRGAATYDVSVSGGGVDLMRTGVAALSCQFDRELPTNVALTWKVRGRNAAARAPGAGA